MMTRRKFVSAAAMSGALASTSMASVSTAAWAETGSVRFDVPAGACDTHVHVLNPAEFPYSAKRRYTPGPATVDQLLALQKELGFDRVVIVQNSVYGSDNRVILDALRKLGTKRARAVASVDETTTDADIKALDEAGVRGIRLNLEVDKDRNSSAAKLQVAEAARRMPKGWHIHINAALSVIASIRGDIEALGAPVVLDHFAHANVPAGVSQPGFSDVVELLQAGKAIVKLSGPYQISKTKDYADIVPVARALIAAAPDRIMWGSDWPHTGGSNRSANQSADVIEPFRAENDAANLSLLADWAPDAKTRRTILVDTPARVYGFS